MSFQKKEINVVTQKHKLVVSCYYDFIEVSNVKTNKKLFLDMCKKGCKNYDNKFCCPPFSPDFKSYVGEGKELFVSMFLINLSQFDKSNYLDYHKVKVGNVILKSRIEKIMRLLESKLNTKFLGTGSCRLCRTCQKKKNLSCKYPSKMRCSLESLGVDCNDLSNKLFKLPLLWYKKGKPIEYTAVLGAIPLDKNNSKEKIITFFNNYLKSV